MDIFESLENLNVSEECFDEIMDIVENVLSAINKSDKSEEEKDELWNKALKARQDEYVWSNLFRKRDPRFKSDNVEIRYTTNKDNDDGRTQKKRDAGKEFKFSKGGRPIYTRNGKIVDMEECFNDIMRLVEEILSESTWDQIEKVHGTYGPSNYKLYQGARNNEQNELKSRLERKFSKIAKDRGININPKSKEEFDAYGKVFNDAKEQSGVDQVGKSYISSRPTKNQKGEYKTYQRQEHNKAQKANASASHITSGDY